MPRGGLKPGGGRPRKDGKPTKAQLPDEWVLRLELAEIESGLTPLEFMLAVMRDEKLPPKTRAAMAIAAAPYMHAKAGEVAQGKKAARDHAAKTAGQGTEWGDDLAPRANVN